MITFLWLFYDMTVKGSHIYLDCIIMCVF